MIGGVGNGGYQGQPGEGQHWGHLGSGTRTLAASSLVHSRATAGKGAGVHTENQDPGGVSVLSEPSVLAQPRLPEAAVHTLEASTCPSACVALSPK